MKIISVEHNVCYGLNLPEDVSTTICTRTVNEHISSVDATDDDGNHYTIWYAGTVTTYIDEEKLYELESTTAEQDELIAELLESDN